MANAHNERSKNIFLDILKVAPLVELCEDEHSQTIQCSSSHSDIHIISHAVTLNDPQKADFPCDNKKNKLPVRKRRRRSSRLGQISKLSSNNYQVSMNEEEKCQLTININSSDHLNKTKFIAEDSKDDDVVFVEEVSNSNVTSNKPPWHEQSKASGKSQKKSTKNKRCIAPPHCENNIMDNFNATLDTSLESSNSSLLTTFVSRIRTSHPSSLVHPDNYTLCQLRYFNKIEGREVPVSGNYSRNSFSVVSYNVLCQSTMDRTLFLYGHLSGRNTVFSSWNMRSRLLGAELARLEADIYCLQEVEDCHFEEFFQPYFAAKDFTSIYCRRSTHFPDGCAIFFSNKKFSVQKYADVRYNLSTTGMHCDNVGQVMVLKFRGTNTEICVSNTHILYNQKRGDIKISQIAYLFAKMHQVEMEIRSSINSFFAGHVLCGDFNIEPFSPIYNFIVQSKIDMRPFTAAQLPFDIARLTINDEKKMKAKINLSGMNISASCTFKESSTKYFCLTHDSSSCTTLNHNFKFASVYEHQLSNGEREISMYVSRQAVCPDFIFYTVAEPKAEDSPVAEAYIRLKKRLYLPRQVDLQQYCGPMPNIQSGSDHLSLFAEFEVLCPT